MLPLTTLMIFLRKRRLTQRCGAKGVRVSGRKETRQHVAELILAAEEECEDADPLFCFAHI